MFQFRRTTFEYFLYALNIANILGDAGHAHGLSILSPHCLSRFFDPHVLSGLSTDTVLNRECWCAFIKMRFHCTHHTILVLRVIQFLPKREWLCFFFFGIPEHTHPPRRKENLSARNVVVPEAFVCSLKCELVSFAKMLCTFDVAVQTPDHHAIWSEVFPKDDKRKNCERHRKDKEDNSEKSLIEISLSEEDITESTKKNKDQWRKIECPRKAPCSGDHNICILFSRIHDYKYTLCRGSGKAFYNRSRKKTI